MGAVAPRSSSKTVPLHDAGESPALTDPNDIDKFTGFKNLHRDLMAHFDLAHIIRPDLLQDIVRPLISLCKMTLQWLVYPCSLFGQESELKGLITVPFSGLFLNDGARPSFDNGYGCGVSIFQENLCHSEFSAKDSLHILLARSHSLIKSFFATQNLFCI